MSKERAILDHKLSLPPHWLIAWGELKGSAGTRLGCVKRRHGSPLGCPVVALWELYKCAPVSKTMGKSCTGVQAWCPVP